MPGVVFLAHCVLCQMSWRPALWCRRRRFPLLTVCMSVNVSVRIWLRTTSAVWGGANEWVHLRALLNVACGALLGCYWASVAGHQWYFFRCFWLSGLQCVLINSDSSCFLSFVSQCPKKKTPGKGKKRQRSVQANIFSIYIMNIYGIPVKLIIRVENIVIQFFVFLWCIQVPIFSHALVLIHSSPLVIFIDQTITWTITG